MRRHLRARGLGYVLAGLFLASLVAQYVFQVHVVLESLPQFLSSMFENWQSEFLQLFCQVAFPVWLYFRNSPVSREQADRVEEKVNWLVRKLGGDADRLDTLSDPTTEDD